MALIRFYRKFLSPLKPPCCRFTPTCSAYALDAFRKRGFFVGFGLMIWRILRCNPFGGSGYDPVPEKRVRITYPTVPKYSPSQDTGETNGGEDFSPNND